MWSQVAWLLAENQTLCIQLAWYQEERAMLQTHVRPLPSKQSPTVLLTDGNHQNFRGFLNQCSLIFNSRAVMYPTDQTRVEIAIILLAGEVLNWAFPLLEQESLMLTD